MTLSEFRDFVISIDPNAGHYTSAYEGSDAFTIWQEGDPLPIMADGAHLGARRFEIGRFTHDEGDEIAEAFREALEESDEICFSHRTDYLRYSGYIGHIFECEAI